MAHFLECNVAAGTAGIIGHGNTEFYRNLERVSLRASLNQHDGKEDIAAGAGERKHAGAI